MKAKGFTLIELIMVVVILSLLAAMVLPRFIDLQSQAYQSATKGALGAIRSAVAVHYASRAIYGITPYVPLTLDATMFKDSQFPYDQTIAPPSNALTVTGEAPPVNTSSGGWWYDSGSGRVWVNNSSYTDW